MRQDKADIYHVYACHFPSNLTFENVFCSVNFDPYTTNIGNSSNANEVSFLKQIKHNSQLEPYRAPVSLSKKKKNLNLMCASNIVTSFRKVSLSYIDNVNLRS